MILATDVQYYNNSGIVAGVEFASWTTNIPSKICISHIESVSTYIPGQFYKRELPCILSLINEHNLSPKYIVIDGYVYLDGYSKPGLGKHLYDALHGKIKIIGVAKKPFSEISDEYEIFRGSSKKPLYITCAGEELSTAKANVRAMYGNHRIPYMLNKVDQVCRQKAKKQELRT